MQYTVDAKAGGEYDVIVCGAGTAGVVAAISAAMSAKNGVSPDEIDVKAVQKILLDNGGIL
jgi:succinate dehydrogenase/fumarate reductase flavoprotein subunit